MSDDPNDSLFLSLGMGSAGLQKLVQEDKQRRAAKRAAAKTRPPLERDIQKAIMRALEKRHDLGRFTRNNVGQLNDRNGVPLIYGLGSGSPDIVGAVAPSGRFIGLEVKRPGEKPSRAQLAWAARWVPVGVFWVVVHSEEEALEAVRRCQGGEVAPTIPMPDAEGGR